MSNDEAETVTRQVNPPSQQTSPNVTTTHVHEPCSRTMSPRPSLVVIKGVALHLDRIAERVRAHYDAGADSVSVQVISDQPTQFPREHYRRLATALL